MKKAFTLIELLIVIAVMVILMGIVVRVSGVGQDSWRRTMTVTRLQRLENCLSGYYAVFGNYPPVKLQGTRDIFQSANAHGIQTDQRNENLWGWTRIGENAEQIAWNQVSSACKAQPVDCRFPYPQEYYLLVQAVSEGLKKLAQESDQVPDYRKPILQAGFDDGVTDNINRHQQHMNDVEWRDIQLFRFGLMSFLLPRYLVMMNGDQVFFEKYAQWTGNNEMPSDPFTGDNFADLGGWSAVRGYATSTAMSSLARVANIPSQAVCARWMPNLDGICGCNHDFNLFGVNIRSTSVIDPGELHPANINIEIFSPGDADADSTAGQYVLDGVTVRDGWGHNLYYYSPSPYQRYTLWSGGANGRTFPPWINRKALSAKANECIGKWVNDDIIHLSN